MINEEKAFSLLKKYSNDEESYEYVLKHVKAVKEVAIRIAKKVKGVDLELIKIGSLLHDIGRFETFKDRKERIRHGVVGGEILRKEGLNDCALIAQRHIGVGITKEDIIKQGLPLPEQDFLPISKEEKIIAHADNCVFGDKEVEFEKVLNRYREELGEEYVVRLKKLKEEIESWMKK